jgi:hypothetical protein
VYITHDAHTWIYPGKLFNGNNGCREVHARATVLLWDLNAHQTLLEHLFDHSRLHFLCLIHVSDFGQYHIIGKL